MIELAPRSRRRLEDLWVEAKWRRYADDPVEFFRECIWIPSPGSKAGRQLFDPFDYQLETLDTFQGERFVVVLKARQLGLTTLAMAYALWLLLFRPGTNILLVSRDQRTANRALDMIDFMWRFVPEWVKIRGPRLSVDSATEHVWEFDDGLTSRIVSLPATKTAGAGETATLVLWDEAALAVDQEESYKTLKPTTDAGGDMIVFSTARGAHNRFARLYREAERGDNEFVTVFHPWYVSRFLNPQADNVTACDVVPCEECVDRSRYEAKRKEFEDAPWEFFSEYPESPEEAFRESGRSRFPDLPPIDDFEELGWRGRIQAGTLVEDSQGPLRLRPAFLQGAPDWAKVVIAVDPSGGVGGDFSAVTIGFLDQDGVPQRIGFWHDNVTEPVDVAREVADLGYFFRGRQQSAAHVAVEKAGGWGDTVINELHRNLNYPNLYLHRKTGHRKHQSEMVFGFPMNVNQRPKVIDRLAMWLPSQKADKSQVMQGIDPLLRHELGAFIVTENDRYEADVGMHDDLVMSAAIWVYVLEEVGPPDATVDTKGKKRDQTVRIDVSHIFREAEEARQQAMRSRGREGRSQIRELGSGRWRS